MAGKINFTFENVVFTCNAQGDNIIFAANGSSFVWSESDGVELAVTTSQTSITISSAGITFDPSEAVSINGTASISLQAGEGYDPAITFPSFQGTILVSWPSTTGPQSGEASVFGITLKDFAG